MSNKKFQDIADKYNLDIKFVTHWAPPSGDDLRPLITMPNIPRPIQGEGCQPRTIYRPKDWNAMRRACYEKAHDTCEICGECPEDKRARQSHECFVIDYEKGVATFVGCFCLCKKCHLLGIHTGRAITLYSKGSPLISKDLLLAGAENAFTIISSYNRDHPGADLRAYSTFTEYLKHDELREPMLELIRTYGIKFYHEDESRQAKWREWSVHLDGEEYPTPYKNEKEWQREMEKKNYNDKFGKGVEANVRQLTDEEIKEEREKLKKF